MRFLSIAIIAVLSLVGIATSTSAQQVNRPTLADVLGPTLGSGGTLRLTFPDKSGNYVQDHLMVLIPKQEPQVITDGTATLKYGMSSLSYGHEDLDTVRETNKVPREPYQAYGERGTFVK